MIARSRSTVCALRYKAGGYSAASLLRITVLPPLLDGAGRILSSNVTQVESGAE
jgi:hypothetical protein